MGKLYVLAMLVLAVAIVGCRKGINEDGGALVSKKFLDDSNYSIVCLGYPKADLEGVARIESAKRAALLNAYYYVGQIFDDSVAPDKDGKVEKYEVEEDSATVYYVIHKNKLRDRLKK